MHNIQTYVVHTCIQVHVIKCNQAWPTSQPWNNEPTHLCAPYKYTPLTLPPLLFSAWKEFRLDTAVASCAAACSQVESKSSAPAVPKAPVVVPCSKDWCGRNWSLGDALGRPTLGQGKIGGCSALSEVCWPFVTSAKERSTTRCNDCNFEFSFCTEVKASFKIRWWRNTILWTLTSWENT